MELKEITQKVLELFEIKDIYSFPKRINDIIFGEQKKKVFDDYINLLPDLTIDWLQHIYQFYCADRKEKKQDYTPLSISKLVSALTYIKGEHIVYDCCSGSGSLVIQQWNFNKSLKFICEELDSNVIPILLFNLSIRNIEAKVINKNVLTGEVYASYEVTKGNKYGVITKSLFPTTEELIADICVCNPPFNLNVPISQDIIKLLPEKYSCNFAFVQYCLSRTSGRCAVILPAGCLSSKNEELCRQSIAEKRHLKAAINLPGNMFESTSVNTCILFFDKAKNANEVMLIDASNMATQKVREQRGEGDASHYNRIYKKTFNVFSDEQIYAINQLTEIECDKLSKKISFEELSNKRYNLCLLPYLPIEFEGTLHRDFNQIISDINRIIRERNVIKITVNKVWAKELGLDTVAGYCNQSNEAVKSLNEMLQKFKNYKVDENIIENKYIQISNSKIFSIENTDKGILSSIMPFFIGMYKQHIYYLNLEENRLLAELRDAMLPFLMNGTIQFDSDIDHNQ